MENDRINRVTAQQMRDQLSDLLNRAAYLHEPTLVTRQGKAVAVLVSVEDWEEYLRLKNDSKEIAAQADSILAEANKASGGAGNGREEKI
ncbi:type II toxin-antitoxin system Phd/YefM family antitoxin [Salmonirosea aquatica]|uniref:Antitoxin n=1 Tax=Salmonirosea aquatica TaxID=2654236 RepID=A0A7C9FAW5_9BACT|nr:type II toxin-antitoxin system prevent-host-death family antitoxin [Cytophagaceae bacterium SJW1-29]